MSGRGHANGDGWSARLDALEEALVRHQFDANRRGQAPAARLAAVAEWDDNVAPGSGRRSPPCLQGRAGLAARMSASDGPQAPQLLLEALRPGDLDPPESAAHSAGEARLLLPPRDRTEPSATAGRRSPSPLTQHEVGDGELDGELRRLWIRGLICIASFAALAGCWSTTASLSSAVIAPGQLVVDSNSKKIQHPTGGIVEQIMVREGDHVAQGDLLIRLDETAARTSLQVIVGQLDELAGRKVRLEAERDGSEELHPPAELVTRISDPEVARIVAAEHKLFHARRATRESQRGQLTRRIAQLQSEVTGLQAQKEANAREAQIIAEELEGVRELFKKQLTPIMRLNGLERQAVGLQGQRGQLTASIAQIEGRIAEVELQIAQLGEDLRAETQRELREVQGKIAELSERRIAARDQLQRVELRAPNAGYVHQLAVHTIGGVITAAELLMLIVPAEGELVLEAKVSPQDRDQLQVDQKATVRIQASGQRRTPQLHGKLTRIAADVSRDSDNSTPFYTVRVAISADEIARLQHLGISAGMQAEVFIETQPRSLVDYLLRPLIDQASRALREH